MILLLNLALVLGLLMLGLIALRVVLVLVCGLCALIVYWLGDR